MQVPTRAELSRLPSRPLSRGRNRTKADVTLLERGAEKIVLKDFGGRGVLVRNTIGRFSVARECRALARLDGVGGIPRFVGRIDAHALAWEFIEGRALPQLRSASLARSFFDALDRLLERVHGRGVAIADLHHRNVIVAEPTGSPYLIDFSLAVGRPAGAWNVVGRWIYERAAEIDRIAASRIRERYQVRDGGIPEGAAAVTAGASGGAHAAGGAPVAGNPPAKSALYRWGRRIKRAMRRLRGRT